jgi:hypothetical protein
VLDNIMDAGELWREESIYEAGCGGHRPNQVQKEVGASLSLAFEASNRAWAAANTARYFAKADTFLLPQARESRAQLEDRRDGCTGRASIRGTWVEPRRLSIREGVEPICCRHFPSTSVS